MKIKVCMGTNCVMNGAMTLFDQLNSLNELIGANPDEYKIDAIELEAIKCQKVCKKHIGDYKNVVIYVDNEQITEKDPREVVEYIMNIIKK